MAQWSPNATAPGETEEEGSEEAKVDGRWMEEGRGERGVRESDEGSKKGRKRQERHLRTRRDNIWSNILHFHPLSHAISFELGRMGQLGRMVRLGKMGRLGRMGR